MPALFARPQGAARTGDRAGVVFETALGWMAIAVGSRGLESVAFGGPNLAVLVRSERFGKMALVDAPPRWVRDLREQLVRFAEGEPQTFDEVPLDIEELTPFARQVLGECRKLRWGQVMTYAELAHQAGRPGAARAVGNVMANNRFPLVVPCHRVIGSGGGLGGYSAPGGLATKRRLLEAEGVL